MLKKIRKLKQKLRRAVSKEARDRYEALQEELAIRRVLAKAIKNDSNGGVVMDKTFAQNVFQSDRNGVVLDPTDTTTTLKIIVKDENPTAEDVALFADFIRHQKFVRKQRKLIKESSDLMTGADSDIDPYTDFSWIENNR